MAQLSNVHAKRQAQFHLQLQIYGSAIALATAAGLSPSRVSHLLSGYKTIGEKAARDIERRLKLPPGWMDGDDGSPPYSVELNADVYCAIEKNIVFKRSSVKQQGVLLGFCYWDAAKRGSVDRKALDHLMAAYEVADRNKTFTQLPSDKRKTILEVLLRVSGAISPHEVERLVLLAQ